MQSAQRPASTIVSSRTAATATAARMSSGWLPTKHWTLPSNPPNCEWRRALLWLGWLFDRERKSAYTPEPYLFNELERDTRLVSLEICAGRGGAAISFGQQIRRSRQLPRAQSLFTRRRRPAQRQADHGDRRRHLQGKRRRRPAAEGLSR